jgi:hypothetical protein
MRLLGADKGGRSVKARVHDPDRAVYRIRPLADPEFRQYAVVPRRHCVELICLPTKWRVLSDKRYADVEIGVQQMRPGDTFCASATVIDESLGMLIGYLSSGSLAIAREMAETAQELLYHKMENPFAAAAGGYALVGTAERAESQEWHHWIENLAQRFPQLPDGAIQFAQLRLRMRRHHEDVQQARHAFKDAYHRGLPFFSMGLKWLMEGLEWFSEEDPEAAEMLRHVRQLAWRTNFAQAFTSIRIGSDVNV